MLGLQIAATVLASTLALDLDGDGKLDTVSLSQTKTFVTVRVRFGDSSKKPETFFFPVDAGNEDAVCRIPVVLRKTKAGFDLVDEACDSIHFFYNRKTERMNYWRL